MNMKRLSIDSLKQLIFLAGMNVHPCKKTIDFKREPVEVTGFEVTEDGAVVQTFFELEGKMRMADHREGAYYVDTTYWNEPHCRLDNVLRIVALAAIEKIRDGLRD
jgi:hypothetical protein